MLAEAERAVDVEESTHPYDNYTHDLTQGTTAFPVVYAFNYAEIHMLMSSTHFGEVPYDYASIVHDDNNRSNFGREAMQAADRLEEIFDIDLT